MKASDIMTSPAITVGPHTPVAQIAALLAERRISAVPVVEDGRLVGLVSEADLLHRHEIGTDGPVRTGPSWLQWLSGGRSAAEYVRSHAVRARDVMTHEVFSAAADASVADIVALMEKRKVKRVPILRGAELVGIVSRADVVRAVAAKRGGARTESPGDEAIRARIAAELEGQPWWRAPYSSVQVTDGVVHYLGLIDSEDERSAARVAAENIPGVRGVEDHRFTMYDIPSMV
jgi:CBS domain-containing protein